MTSLSMASTSTASMTIPFYELHQNDEKETLVLQDHFRKAKPLAGLIESLCATEDSPPIYLASPNKREHGLTSCSPRQKMLQEWLATRLTLSSKATGDSDLTHLLDLTEQLLETAIYAGLNSTFCEFIITEIIYYAQRKQLELYLYNVDYEAEFGPISWKEFPKHPFLHKCLHEDVEFKTDGKRDQSNVQNGKFFIRTFNQYRDLRNAIQSGNLRFLNLLGPFDRRSVVTLTAIYGQLHILQWLQSAGYKLPWSTDLCAITAMHGHFEMLKWLKLQGCPWSERTCESAAKSGHLEILKWARAQGCPWNVRTCCMAAKNGRLEILKWSRENECPWDASTCFSAAENGFLNVLKWAREQGCPWDERTCRYAAYKGQLDVLRWAREQGCPWDKSTCDCAARNGHFEALQWLKAAGCPWDRHVVLTQAEFFGHHKMVEWILTQT